jgi:hemolysin activation/secretion protein
MLAPQSFATYHTNCLKISSIDIVGTSLREELIPIINKHWENTQCIDTKKILKLIHYLNGYLLKEGYITSKATIKLPQDISSNGLLTIIVTDGILNKFLFFDQEGNPIPEGKSNHLYWMLKDLEGKPLKIHQLDDRIEKLKALSLRQTTLDIIPTDRVGYSNIHTKHGILKAISLSQTYTHGLLQNSNDSLLIQGNLNQLLGINDGWSFSRQINSPDTAENHSINNQASLTIPYRSFESKINHSRTISASKSGTANTPFLIENDTEHSTLLIKKTLHRNTRTRLYMHTGADHRINTVHINQTLSEVSSHKNSAAEIGLEHNLYFSPQNLTWKLTHRRGTDWFDADKDSSVTTNLTPKRQFQLNKISINYSYVNNLRWIGGVFSAQIDGQQSQDVLLNQERLSYASSSADTGLLIKPQYQWLLGKEIAKFFTAKNHITHYLKKLLSSFTYTAKWDYFRYETNSNTKNELDISSHAINLNLSGKHWQLGFTHNAQSLSPNEEDGSSQNILFTLSY